MPCNGQNRLIITDGTILSKPICGIKPAITSTTSELYFMVVLGDPGPQVIQITRTNLDILAKLS